MKESRYYLDKIDGSSYPIALLTKANHGEGRQLRDSHIWKAILGEDQTDDFIAILPGNEKGEKTFDRNGIAFEFSKLKNLRDINGFSSKYGLLGIKAPSPEKKRLFKKTKRIFGDSAFLVLDTGDSYCEPVELWFFYINQIQKILKLYKALISIHAKEMDRNYIEVNLLNIGIEVNGEYLIEWWDGSFTGYTISTEMAEEGDFLQIAKELLATIVSRQGNQRINSVVTDVIETNKPPLGFTIEESKYTEHLINAIYYDVWQLISRNEPVHICNNPNCRLPFKKVKRQKYCSSACKQEAYRIRKKKGGN